MKTVLLFNTTRVDLVLIHAESCKLVSAARKSRGLIRVVPHTDAAVADFIERGWKVRSCKCAKEEPHAE